MIGELSPWAAPAIALSSAAFFGLLVHLQLRGLDTNDGSTGALVNSAALAGMFWLTSPLWLDASLWSTRGALIYAGLGIFFPVGALWLQMLAVPRMGPVLTGALGSFTPFFAIVPAIFLFGEEIGLQGWAGLLLMTCGLIAATVSGRKFKRNWPLWAAILPLCAAAIRGGMQPGLKVALETAPSAAFGVMLMATVSTLLMLFLRVVSRQPMPRPNRGWKWFALAGMAQGTALFLLTTALRLGDVVIAAALSSTAPLWGLFYGAVLFKREVLGLRHLWVALLVVAGGGILVSR